MNTIIILREKKKLIINLDNVLYVEERVPYTSSELEPQRAATVYFTSGSSIDVNVDVHELFDKIESMADHHDDIEEDDG